MRKRPATRLLRSVVAGLFFAVWGAGSVVVGIFALPVAALCGPRGGRGRRMRATVRATYRLFVFAARLVRLFRVETRDPGALRAVRGRVVAANHLTLIDVVVLMSMLPDSTCVAKGAAAENPFLRWIVRPLYLVRGDDTERLLAEAAELLRSGVNVIVFPEGTRTPADAPSHVFTRGFARIALAAGAPVVPVRISCDPPVLAKGQPWYDVADREVVFSVEPLEEMEVSGPSTHAAAAAIAESAQRMIFGKEVKP